MDRLDQLHLAFQALSDFQDKNKRLPKPRNEADANEFLGFVKTRNVNKVELDEKLLKQFAYISQGDVAPMIAFIGGLVAQEVLKVSLFFLVWWKACSSKFHPIVQNLYFDSLESLPNEPINEASSQPVCKKSSYIIRRLGAVMTTKLPFSERNFKRKLLIWKSFW